MFQVMFCQVCGTKCQNRPKWRDHMKRYHRRPSQSQIREEYQTFLQSAHPQHPDVAPEDTRPAAPVRQVTSRPAYATGRATSPPRDAAYPPEDTRPEAPVRHVTSGPAYATGRATSPPQDAAYPPPQTAWRAGGAYERTPSGGWPPVDSQPGEDASMRLGRAGHEVRRVEGPPPREIPPPIEPLIPAGAEEGLRPMPTPWSVAASGPGNWTFVQRFREHQGGAATFTNEWQWRPTQRMCSCTCTCAELGAEPDIILE